MSVPREIDLRITAALMALELLVVSLIRKSPELRALVATFHAPDEEMRALGRQSLAGRPEVSDMLASELAEAWQRLLSRVTDAED